MDKNFKKEIKKLWIAYLCSLVILVLLFISVSMGWLGFMPSIEELENPKSFLATEIYSADQVLIGKYYIENRSNVDYQEISPDLIHALIATEDVRFEKHPGIDMKALYRAVFGVVTGSSKGGGSTITQQLAKNLFPRDENASVLKVIFVKFKEWITAVRLERGYTKEEIIAMYFNTVPFGSQTYGIKSAARTYFNKAPSELNIQEAAMLVGMLKAPTWYSPVRNPERAAKRREVVLKQMVKYDFIKKEQYDSIKSLPLDMSHYQVQDHTVGLATYFREYLRDYLTKWCKDHKKPNGKPYDLYKDGLKVYTTINSKMQKYAEEAVRQYLGGDLQKQFFDHWKGKKNAPFCNVTQEEIDRIMRDAMKRTDRYRNLKKAMVHPDTILKIFNTPVRMKVFSWKGEIDTVMSPMDSIRYSKFFLQCGLMSMEPQTGFIRAYVGGIDYKYFQYDHVIVGRRQVGSTFKPFVYALALQELGYSPCKQVPNIPVTFDLPTGQKWTPENSDDEGEGKMVSLKWAIANSVNYISAYLMKRLSPQGVIELAYKMGITTPIDTVPSICLGTPDVSVCEMTGAFSVFANKGIYNQPVFITRIEDRNGNVLENFIPEQHEAMSEETAYLMVSLLQGVVDYGTGTRLRFRYGFTNPIAGKTGTTQNQSDGWFIGITPDLVTGVWVGCEDRAAHFRGIFLGQGANTSLPIWALYMQKVYADPSLGVKKNDFEKPLNELSVETDCNKYKESEAKDEKLFDNQNFN